ncbi:phosphate/phosphite/phosphonate ABC transporter substrate-binding protein [Aliagarivorans taiwanensis]|uniref:phosphate/phosphite/phosphonate ABC transporter substrate-binding protein n=1 Tax=Aliagarivorans taiwanensis TaxID=561966 RepID=UPI000421CA30|nr:phosphate/phosphite/phosphonate ABC transporter substrate-binding protein [Aliagarivorans taiwanensis]
MSKQYQVLAVVISLFLLFPPSAYSAKSDDATLVLGVISTNPKKAVKRTTPFAKYLVSQLQDHGVTQSKVMVATNLEQMVRWMKAGKVDMVSDTVFSAVTLVNEAGAELLARRWKSGVAEYSSVFFSRQDSEIQSFDQLLGKTVVFEDRYSTSAYFVPVIMLLEQGFTLYEQASLRDMPPADSIGYVFVDEISSSSGEVNMSAWVFNGQAAAAAFSNLDWEKEIPPAMRQELEIFASSIAIPRALQVARPGLPIELKQALTEVMLSAHLDEQGQDALSQYKKTAQFDELDQAVQNSIDWVEKAAPLLEQLY